MVSVRQFQVTFDCADPVRVARFWAEVLGYDVVEAAPDGDGAWAACTDPTGTNPRLFFQRVPEGKVVKNRVHLDVRVGRVSSARSVWPPSKRRALGSRPSAPRASSCNWQTRRTSPA